MIDSIEEFVSQLSEITLRELQSNRIASALTDAMRLLCDLITEYQIVRVLPGYQIVRSLAKFNLVMGNGSLIHVEELPNKTTIQL